MKSFILAIPRLVPTVLMVLVAIYFTLANNPMGVNAMKGVS